MLPVQRKLREHTPGSDMLGWERVLIHNREANVTWAKERITD